jgi:AcrR family transcriptional regulator
MNPLEIKPLSQEMEERILLSATQVFVLKGKAGASMQEIATAAGINRTLLNYYFRSKDNLFEQVFSKLFLRFLPGIVNTLQTELPVERRFESFIDSYFAILLENPIVPIFILQEITSNPSRLIDSLKSGGISFIAIIKSLEKEMELGKIRRMDPREILVNLMSLIIFPFAARKIIEEFIFSGDSAAYSNFIFQRKDNLKQSFIQSLKP